MKSTKLAAALTTIVTPAWAQPVTQGPGYCGPWGYWSWPMMGPFSMIILLTGVVLLVVLGVRWYSQSAAPMAALDILKARYARGEIDKAEFEQKKKDLG